MCQRQGVAPPARVLRRTSLASRRRPGSWPGLRPARRSAWRSLALGRWSRPGRSWRGPRRQGVVGAWWIGNLCPLIRRFQSVDSRLVSTPAFGYGYCECRRQASVTPSRLRCAEDALNMRRRQGDGPKRDREMGTRLGKRIVGLICAAILGLGVALPTQASARSCKPPNLGDVAVVYRLQAAGLSCWDASGVVAAFESRRRKSTTLWGTWRCRMAMVDEASWRDTCSASGGRRVVAWATAF